ncbi:ras guanine nucleotide exchange factor Q-like [Condylostylus longicornis]|uniref:ras guanine nucleotide exchange factor Q-like n=1 Tax=Condylostylus longicornis TaxID=2530218 RepID=UPI00244DE44B|nr:ras guanine nucleotide exchange factor Q-like [Condylostylus longicornis]
MEKGERQNNETENKSEYKNFVTIGTGNNSNQIVGTTTLIPQTTTTICGQGLATGTTTTTIQFPSSSSLSSNEFNSLTITNSDSCSISSFNSINKSINDNNSQTSRSSSTENSPTKNATKTTINENDTIGISTSSNAVAAAVTTTTSLKSFNNIKDELPLIPNSNSLQNDYIICDSTSNIGNNLNQNNGTSPDDILTKPEFTSSMLKNLPVRQKKSVIQHMDNYCLFDPSVDFINEKSLSTSGIGLNSNIGGGCNNSGAASIISSYCTTNNTISSGCVNNTLISLSNDYKLPLDNHQHSNLQCFPINSLPYNNDNDFVEEIIYDETADAYSAGSDEAIYTNILKNGHHIQQQQQQISSTSIQSSTSSSATSTTSSVDDQNLTSSSSLATTENLLNEQDKLQQQEGEQQQHTIPIESNCILFNTGRIYNINNQYKIRKPRPLSTNSDADSGFLSPNSPDELKFNPALLMLEQCDSIQGYIEPFAPLTLQQQTAVSQHNTFDKQSQ